MKKNNLYYIIYAVTFGILLTLNISIADNWVSESGSILPKIELVQGVNAIDPEPKKYETVCCGPHCNLNGENKNWCLREGTYICCDPTIIEEG